MKESEMFKASSAQHADAQNACAELYKCNVEMGKEAGAGAEGTMFRKVASHFQKLAGAHGGLSDLHAQCAADCEAAEKAALDQLNKIRPDGYSSVGRIWNPRGPASRQSSVARSRGQRYCAGVPAFSFGQRRTLDFLHAGRARWITPLIRWARDFAPEHGANA
jgi:hypothetical protein